MPTACSRTWVIRCFLTFNVEKDIYFLFMSRRIFITFLFNMALTAFFLSTQAVAQVVTVLYDDRVVELTRTLADPNDLWVVPRDLPRVNGFELKPEGACLDELCVPVLQDRDSEMFVRRSGQAWFNVTELAGKLEQAYVANHDDGVWSFGEIPVTRGAFLNSAIAPDFSLPNREGTLVRLSDFRGKKVLILTWASW